jgi:hypothetical protein
MANIQQLIFDIIARDSASPAFAKLGTTAQGAAGNVSDLSKRIDELGRKSAEARVGLQGNQEAQAQLDKLDARLLSLTHKSANPSISIEGAARAAAEISALELELDKLSKKGGSADKATSALGTSGLSGMGGMGALIAAGVVLSPIVATLGIGLAGFGAAAAGAVVPIDKAAQKTGGLQKNMHLLNPEQQALAQSLLALGQQYHAFEQQLQPEVFGVFNQGLHLASVLMHDVQPVASATGKAFGQFLGQFSAMLNDQNWRQFWAFMASTAPQDMRALGGLVIDLSNDIAILVPHLQGLALATLQVTDDFTKLLGAGEKVQKSQGNWIENIPVIGSLFRHMAEDANGTWHSIVNLGGASDKAAPQVAAVGVASQSLNKWAMLSAIPIATQAEAMREAALRAQFLSQMLQASATQTTALMTAQSTALNTQLAYGSAILTSANDAQALRDKLKLSWGMIGLQTQAQRDSFGAAQTYIKDLGDQATQAFASGHGVDAAMKAISDGLPLLDSAKTKNKQYWQEVQTLVGWLDRLRAEKAISEAIHVSGTGVWSVTPGKIGLPGGTAGGPFAAGGMIGGGIPGRDSVIISAMPGEVVVPVHMVQAGALDHLRGALPGFAGGGVVGSYAGNVAGLGPWSQGELNLTANAIVQSTAAALVAGIQSSQAQASLGAHAGPGGGSALANAMLAIALEHPSAADFAAWNNVAMAESGWNQFALNASSGAYGIAQALPPTKYPFAGQAAGGSNPTAQITWMWNYMQQRYGGPQGAWAHEQAFHWYDGGGTLLPGLTLNTTGRKESVLGSRAEDLLKELVGAVQENTDVLASAIATLTGVTAQGPAVMGAAMAGGARASVYGALYP